MFRDMSGLLFVQDGVSPDFIRAGAPRLSSRSRSSQDLLAAQAPARRPSLLQRLRLVSPT